MTDTDKNPIDLDVFFQDAKEPTPELSNGLMARILADAGEVVAPPPVKPQRAKRWLPAWLEPMGGMQGLAAVGFSAIIGISIGYAGTDSLQSIPGIGDIVATFSTDPLDDFAYGEITSFNDFLAEG